MVTNLQGEVVVALLIGPLYDCRAAIRTDRKISIFATISHVVPWILRTLVEESKCPCVGRYLRAWSGSLVGPFAPSFEKVPGERYWHLPGKPSVPP